MASGEDLVKELTDRFPQLRPLYDDHVAFMGGEVLPHVLVPDLTEAVVEAYLRPGSALDWVGFLSFLDQEYGTGDPYLRGIVEVGFLEQLPYPFEDGHGIVRDLPPRLRSAFQRIRSAG